MPQYIRLTRRQKARLFVLLLLLLITIPGASNKNALGQLEPGLLPLVTTTPDTMVPVIVQLQPNAPAITNALSELGGTQTKSFTMIHAIVVELPARQLPALASLAAVRWISLDAPVIESRCIECISTRNLQTVYNEAIGATQLWNKTPYLQGQGIGVAVVDSAIHKSHKDFGSRVIAGESTVLSPRGYDGYGHGTFVAGIIGGDGRTNNGRYIGVAPKSNLIDVKVTNFAGASTESDVLEGLQWIYDNHKTYNIRVVNISLNASKAQSYHTSPLSAAAEILWFNGIVVVTSAGNRGEEAIYPPANDPFVITVGATDDMGTATIADDSVAHFSAYGTTSDGFAKPDLVAPGRHLIGPMANSRALLPLVYPNMRVDDAYMRMSGTSFSAPVVSGAIALLLQQEPTLTPDQVKHRLLKTANQKWPGYDPVKAGAGYLDIAAATRNASKQSANTGIPVSRLLTTGPQGLVGLVGSLLNFNWDSVSWSSVSWSSVSWSSVSWSSVSWSSDYIEDDDALLGLPKVSGLLGLLSRSKEEEDLYLEWEEEPIWVEEPVEVPNSSDSTFTNQIYLPLISSGD